MAKLVEQGIVLEICPSSNLRTHAVADLAELGAILRRFDERGVRYTINTDGPYLLDSHLRGEFDLLLANGHLTPAGATRCIETARAATFLR
jgi:adenosine deaminase